MSSFDGGNRARKSRPRSWPNRTNLDRAAKMEGLTESQYKDWEKAENLENESDKEEESYLNDANREKNKMRNSTRNNGRRRIEDGGQRRRKNAQEKTMENNRNAKKRHEIREKRNKNRKD